MHWIYVLRSLKSFKRYIGVTSQDVVQKLNEHKAGASSWTSKHRPFELIYTERFDSKTDALRREKFLKTGQGRKFLDNVL